MTLKSAFTVQILLGKCWQRVVTVMGQPTQARSLLHVAGIQSSLP